MDNRQIVNKMHELEAIIDYKFEKIEYLANAMNRNDIERPFNGNNKSYSNEYYALIGDAIIKIALSEKLNNIGYKTSGEITIIKQHLENNNSYFEIVEKTKIMNFAYNDYHFGDEEQKTNQVSFGNHDSFIEAITAAIYLDKNFDEAIKWVNNWLFPKLKLLNDKNAMDKIINNKIINDN